jgi:high affinity Mn2+ porin
MFRQTSRFQNPFTAAPVWPRAWVILLLLLAGGVLGGQTPEVLPAVPEPHINTAAQPAGLSAGQTNPFLALLAAPSAPGAADGDGANGGGRSEELAPVVAMAPHTSSRYWISGQANIILQGDLPFHSPYQGTNSFIPRGEYKTSLLGTLFTAYRPTNSIRYNTDLILDLESAGGRGLSQALGLAGFTNLDVVRNPSLSAAPYLARYEIHQVFGLTEKTIGQQPGFFGLAPSVPARRIEFRIGRMALPDFFDVNEVGSDSHLQFMNWTVDNNGAWDYAADTRGYTVGGMAEYDDVQWSLRYGIFAMPTVANGDSLDWAFSRANGQNGEFELRKGFVRGRRGTQRILFYGNRAHMGDYREAVVDFLNGSDTRRYGVIVPTITLHERFGALKYGVGYNFEQDLTTNLRVFGRFGWNEGRHESFAYTEVDQTVEAGADYYGIIWHRPIDKIGVAVVSNAIKADHQNYLRYGGLGFLLGDGKLNYGRENIVETYYNWHAWRGLFYAIDIQHIDDPGYNRDRGPVWVGSTRMHVDF